MAARQSEPNNRPLGARYSMKQQEFDVLLANTFNSLSALTKSKGQEYANSSDQLANFRRLASTLDLIPSVILLVYLQKHLDSIFQYVRSISSGVAPIESEPIQGRIDDAILYLILLKALISEQE